MFFMLNLILLQETMWLGSVYLFWLTCIYHGVTTLNDLTVRCSLEVCWMTGLMCPVLLHWVLTDEWWSVMYRPFCLSHILLFRKKTMALLGICWSNRLTVTRPQFRPQMTTPHGSASMTISGCSSARPHLKTRRTLPVWWYQSPTSWSTAPMLLLTVSSCTTLK